MMVAPPSVFTCADILYFIITGLNRVRKCELEVAGTGSGEGIFIFVFQPNEDLSFRWIGFAPVISFVIGNFHGVDVEIFCVVTGRSYFYFAAAASGTDVRVNGQIDLSHFCFACSKGAGCHAGRNKKGGKKNGSYFFKRIILFIVLSLKNCLRAVLGKQMSANAAACFSTWLIKV